jgi:hypothetical protein
VGRRPSRGKNHISISVGGAKRLMRPSLVSGG